MENNCEGTGPPVGGEQAQRPGTRDQPVCVDSLEGSQESEASVRSYKEQKNAYQSPRSQSEPSHNPRGAERVAISNAQDGG